MPDTTRPECAKHSAKTSTRKPYRAPTINRFGPLGAVTQAGGRSSSSDHGKNMMALS